MSGMPLNHQLVDLGGRLEGTKKTAPTYRLYALSGGPPHRPGLLRVASGGGSIDLEVWSLPLANVGRFLRQIPAPLGLGTVALDDGSEVMGFLCESHAIASAEDITALGGWRAYLKTLA
jgi:allophanate hydrolase